MKIGIVLGTRPEIIKMSSVIKECEKQGWEYFILDTGQHYSYYLARIFYEELWLPQAKYNLNIGSGSHAEETGKMLIEIEKFLKKELPDILLVEGDTNTVLAGALAASKLHIKVGHVEAGLRSYDRSMPEEINRILVDHISDFLFAPTEKAGRTLLKEGISQSKIFITGNTIVDAIYQNLQIAYKKTDILQKLNLVERKYFLVTVHREENTDVKERLKAILEGFGLIYKEFRLPLIFPIHPRTRKRMKEFELEAPKGVKLIQPLGFLEFLMLESKARLILTDSGGIQEEACILKVPCVTLRNSTERLETIEVNSNILAGAEAQKILGCIRVMFNSKNDWVNPFGDGTSGKRIITILKSKLS